jgi:predicted transcriptional regulator
MPTSTPLKSATFLLRLSPEEKADLERKAADRNLTLSEALRSGAAAYLEEAHERTGRRPPRAT